MTNPAITNESGVTFTFADGECDSVQEGIGADIDIFPLPGAGPGSAFGFDYNGATKTITLRGKLFLTATSRTDSGTVTTLLQQKQWLEQNINGAQNAKTFTSNFAGQAYDGLAWVTTQIYMGNITFEENIGEPEILQFNMTLLVGS